MAGGTVLVFLPTSSMRIGDEGADDSEFILVENFLEELRQRVGN